MNNVPAMPRQAEDAGRRARGWVGIAALLATVALTAVMTPPAEGLNLPPGFQDETVFDDIEQPVSVRFSPDGRVFVAEKKGVILVYDDLEDETPTEFADLRTEVYDSGDRGLLSLALDPDFPEQPYVYAFYTYDHLLGDPEPAPKWGVPNHGGDACPLPEGADVDTCPASGRLVRLEAVGDHAATGEVAGEERPLVHVLVEDWCQQFSSHSVGDLHFGPEGALFASAGESANFNDTDFGQFGWPEKNICGDPPGEVGEALKPPTAEGGSLRAQNPQNLDGSVIRVDADTGEGIPGNPMYGSSNANERRVIAYGFRNPFRFAINSETDEVYVGNVGWYSYEEIDRFSTAPSQAYNSGWPCYEGPELTPGFSGLELDVCYDLYENEDLGLTSLPLFSYRHDSGVTPEDDCPLEFGSTMAAMDFYEGDALPSPYEGALFFSDPVRQCIYVMFAGKDERPDPATTMPFMTEGGVYPGVDIQEGPEGALFYAKLFSDEYGLGSIHRISYTSGNQSPVARLAVDNEWSPGDLAATFDAIGSTDAEGEPLEYEWDIDNDGSFEAPGTDGTIEEVYTDAENHTVAVRVRDGHGATSVDRITVFPHDTPPEPQIVTPAEGPPSSGKAALEWHVGQAINFEGGAEDDEDGALAPSSLDWSSRLYHCPTACHVHPLQAFPAVASGTLLAPDHDYPSRIDLTLTATDSRGLAQTTTLEFYPNPVEVTIASNPPGLPLTVGEVTGPAPLELTAIEGSQITLTAPEMAEMDGTVYRWTGWSDGGARVHTFPLDGSEASFTAEYGAPEAKLEVAQSWDANGGLEAEFDASGSATGAEPEYDWNVDGAGFSGSPSPDPTISLALEDAEESHTVAVRVIEQDGSSDTATEVVTAVELFVDSEPAGIEVTVGGVTDEAPFSLLALEGSTVAVAAPASETVGEVEYEWSEWSNEEPRLHEFEIGAEPEPLMVFYLDRDSAADADRKSGAGDRGGSLDAPASMPAVFSAPSLGRARVVLRAHPPRRTRSRVARFAFAAVGSPARVRCKLDRGRFRHCGARRVYRHLRSGRHALRFAAVGPPARVDRRIKVFRWRVLRPKRRSQRHRGQPGCWSRGQSCESRRSALGSRGSGTSRIRSPLNAPRPTRAPAGATPPPAR